MNNLKLKIGVKCEWMMLKKTLVFILLVLLKISFVSAIDEISVEIENVGHDVEITTLYINANRDSIYMYGLDYQTINLFDYLPEFIIPDVRLSHPDYPNSYPVGEGGTYGFFTSLMSITNIINGYLFDNREYIKGSVTENLPREMGLFITDLINRGLIIETRSYEGHNYLDPSEEDIKTQIITYSETNPTSVYDKMKYMKDSGLSPSSTITHEIFHFLFRKTENEDTPEKIFKQFPLALQEWLIQKMVSLGYDAKSIYLHEEAIIHFLMGRVTPDKKLSEYKISQNSVEEYIKSLDGGPQLVELKHNIYKEIAENIGLSQAIAEAQRTNNFVFERMGIGENPQGLDPLTIATWQHEIGIKNADGIYTHLFNLPYEIRGITEISSEVPTYLDESYLLPELELPLPEASVGDRIVHATDQTIGQVPVVGGIVTGGVNAVVGAAEAVGDFFGGVFDWISLGEDQQGDLALCVQICSSSNCESVGESWGCKCIYSCTPQGCMCYAQYSGT